MAALREILALFTVKVDDKPLEEADKKIEKTTDSLKKFGGVLAGIFATGALVGGFRELATEADRLQKAGQTLDVGVEELQAWEHAAALAGVAAEGVAMGFKQITLRSKQAADGSAGMVALLGQIGLKGEDLAKKNPAQQLLDVGAALQEIENPSRRNALAMELLGDSGAEMNRIFAEGGDATRQLLAELEKTAPITQVAAEEFASMNDNVADMDRAWLGLKATLAVAVIPAINWLVDKLKFMAGFLKDVGEQTNFFESAIVTLGAVLTTTYLPVIAKWIALNQRLFLSQLKAFALLALAVLLVDELITTWQGGDTLITRAIDSIFGEGTTKKVVEFVKVVIASVVDFFENFSLWMGELGRRLSEDLDAMLMAIGEWVSSVGDDFIYLGKAMVAPFIAAWNKIKAIIAKAKGGVGTVLSALNPFDGGGSVSAPAGAPAGGSNVNAQFGSTTINVSGSGDPQATAQAVASAQSGVNQRNSGMMAGLVPQGA